MDSKADMIVVCFRAATSPGPRALARSGKKIKKNPSGRIIADSESRPLGFGGGFWRRQSCAQVTARRRGTQLAQRQPKKLKKSLWRGPWEVVAPGRPRGRSHPAALS
jgi:hypothetical protein